MRVASEYVPEGECCPKWNCSGCVDHENMYHALHDVWKTDSCTTHNCTKTGIRTTREECHLGPAPHPACLQYTTPGECCPEWECSGCYDEAGRYRAPGEEWNTGDPCLLYTCGKAGAIKITYIHCEEMVIPHPGCYEYTPEGECCPKLNCSGCVDHAGTHHPLHDVWKTDICTTHVCTNSGIQTEREDCHLEPAPHHSCIEFVPPGKCCSEWQCRGCFDEQGNFHKIGHEWNTGDPCLTYVCTEDGLQTERERCEDIPPPHPGCYQYREKGDCCPVWNCSGCVDNEDHFHTLHEVWKTDVCTTHVCTNSGIHTTREGCHLGPKPHPSCVEYTPPGQCCPEWQCSGCFDKAGNFFEVGREWSTGDPCVTYVCAEGGVTKTIRIHCEDIPPPHESCHEYVPEGECCPKWNCSGCVDHKNMYHPLHEIWKTDSCTTHNCTKTGIRTIREECHLGPAPHPTCLQYTTPGECCPEWECSGCYDEAGRYRAPGEEWNTGDPCLLYTCGKAGAIKITYIHCEEMVIPHPGCYEYTPEGECCPKLNCSGCVDHAGTHHPLHDVWKTDICTTHVCTNSGIQTEREDCHLEPAPHHSCIEFVPPGKCCSEWQCRGCFDEQGNFHKIGHEWNTGDPCLTYVCTEDGLQTERERCEDIPPPHPGCYQYRVKGECCPVWNCSGCVDNEDHFHTLHEVWKTDVCTTHVCTNSGIHTTREGCHLGPKPHPSCVEYTPPEECCPEWQCRGCFDKAGNFFEVGREWSTGDPCVTYVCVEGGVTKTIRIHCEDIPPPHESCHEYVPEGECCPKWNCSGCVDHTNTYHPLSDTWKTDECTRHVCLETGIQTTRKECHLGPAPHHSCLEYTPPGECCPDWHCSGCFDEAGIYHELDEEWDSGDPCMYYHCTKEGIKIMYIQCEDTPPLHSGCYQYTPLGECCPVWNCSGCVDHTNTYRPLFHVWTTDLCTTHICLETGIHTTREECHLGPAPHPSCQQYTPPRECCPEWHCSGCFDEVGNYHENGHKWNTGDPCISYVCTEGEIKIERVHCEETQPPHAGCYDYVPPGECCPKWNCSGCVDHFGTYHKLQDVWKTDPCTTHVCTRTGIQTTHEECHLGPAPHPSCREHTPAGECCSEWLCSGCIDKAGDYYELDQEWRQDDPCMMYKCTDGGVIKIVRIECEEVPPPHAACYEYIPVGECCPQWNCSGCVDHTDTYHPLYDVWKTDLCTTHVCTETGIQTTRVECYLGPPPHPSCLEYTPPGECCPEWECSGCFDDAGKYYELGQEWTTGDPCVLYECVKEGIKVTRIHCEDAPPLHSGCYQYTPEGECCPVWNCSGCVDHDGTYHPLYDVWRSDLCNTHECTRAGILTTREECHLGSAPHPSCNEYTPPGECCPEWHCSGCFDASGIYRELGQEWSTNDPCITYVCTEDGLDINRIQCEETFPLHPDCFDYIPDGECCPKWNCSGCVDYSGKYYTLYSVWKTDPCTTHECTKNGIQTTREDCNLGPAPHHSCEQFTFPGECCPEWKCSGCFDEVGTYHTLGHVWNTGNPCVLYECTKEGLIKTNVECKQTPPLHSGCYEYTPKGECCPIWNCSGCVDHTGTYHPLYDVWKTDICTTHVCSKTGIQTTREECYLGPAPHPSCIEYTPPGECCPDWECSGCFEAGSYHELGHEWSTSDPCILLVCTKDGIKKKSVDCEETPQPHPGCYDYIPAGECCPKWNCSGCVDSSGTYHPLYHIWGSDPCVTYVCTRTGIQTSTEECQLLDPPIDPSCEKVVPAGECCPEWKCSGCIDDYGVYHPLHKEWVTDVCTTHTCTVNGILTETERCHLDPSPHYSCIEYTPEGECCPIWNCSGCIDKLSGTYHNLHSTWQTGPCITHECGESGIKTILEKCKEKPQPHCEEISPPPGECCPQWKCSGCYEAGTHYNVGREWRTDPCTTSLCTDEGIRVTKEICEQSHPPHYSCVEYTPAGECCPTWNCSGCIDADRTYHELGDEWKTDPCSTHLCTSTGIQITKEVCEYKPAPDAKCQEYTPPGECCPKWKCTLDNGFLSSVVLDGCIDEDSIRHKYGHKWLDVSDPCFQYECTRHGVIQRYNICDQ
ncbi:kielin/chordin-like protein isoform X2 [Panulirus ornatus]|uniref:kielin/chordin-like protein isoform X2 n=1 Tax=Panulirus ornatus TaxID=150431 RepID=UPI003A8B3FDD